jgi:hypothetical protein
MATFRYFADIDGRALELSAIHHNGRGTKAPNFSGLLPDGRRVQATRVVEIVPAYRASGHKCGARCLSAMSRSPCECACKGENHGRGAFACDAPALL